MDGDGVTLGRSCRSKVKYMKYAPSIGRDCLPKYSPNRSILLASSAFSTSPQRNCLLRKCLHLVCRRVLRLRSTLRDMCDGFLLRASPACSQTWKGCTGGSFTFLGLSTLPCIWFSFSLWAMSMPHCWSWQRHSSSDHFLWLSSCRGIAAHNEFGPSSILRRQSDRL